jgi:serine/threonine protein kinase
MEMAVSDLDSYRKTLRGKCFPLQQIKTIAYQTSLALEYLHTNKVTHRDLKPTNILVTALESENGTFTTKFADFGFSSHDTSLKTLCGTK